MAEPIEQQIFDIINKSKRILVALPQSLDGDALGAGLAFAEFLKKLEKEPEIVSAVGDLGRFNFLPGAATVKSDLQIFQSFVVSLNTSATKLDELSYEVKTDRVDIFLKPKAGKFAPGDVSFRNAKFPYDLIVTLGAPSLENLGAVYEKNMDLFFETPIVNIDHHTNNELYGEINHVDLTATATSEILAALIGNFEAALIDENMATDLLTGIIVETNSFQHVKTTPRAFLEASNLISLGGKHQEIIKELYKTKNISLLKLWGRALARLREVADLDLAYSLVNQADLAKSDSSASDILGVMKELIANLSGRKIIFFLAEIVANEIIGYVYLHPSLKSQLVMATLGGQMLDATVGSFQIKGQSLLEAEAAILEKLKKIKAQIGL